MQTPSDFINPEGWTSLARNRLISSIVGTWIALRDLDLDGNVDLAKACQGKPIRMRKIDDYSFSMVIDYQSPKGEMDYRAEYIHRRGASYAILLPLGPDVLLEFRGQDGFPELYGRCE